MGRATVESSRLKDFLLDHGAVLSVSIQSYMEG